MKGSFLLLLTLFGLLSNTFAQSKISGKVLDISDKLKLKNASIMLLQAQDSILIDYTRADENGYFEFQKPASGDHLVVVTYPKYADFYKEVKAADSQNDLGEILLTSVAHLIEEVVVRGRAAITIKGDTTEYDASQFTVEKNAKVEDLLKVLPGITVDAAGNITAQGKTVKKVLVDGEEFFGDDPTLVTRNLRSDMVDKVQVYEKRSDQAERTGVDDGVREQTINVQLKEDAKNGIFGKALAGAGTDKYYMGQLMFNKFKGSQKISAYGLFGNNGTTSMNWEDAQKFGGDSGVTYNDEGGMFVDGSFQDPFSGQGVVGIPRAINSGVNFNDKLGGDKHTINLSYKYGNLKADGSEETIMSGVINSNSNKIVDTKNEQHRVNLRYDLKLDSLNSLLVRGGVTRKKLWSDNNLNSANFNENADLIAANRSRQIEDNDVENYNMNMLFTKKFMKKGRSLSLSAAAEKERTYGFGTLYSTKSFMSLPDTITDQFKNRDQNMTNVKAGVSYTEPLTSVLNLSLGYNIDRRDNASLLESFNKNVSGNYDILDENFSNNYDFNRLSNNFNVTLSYVTEKLRGSFVNNLNDDALEQKNNYTSNTLKRSFFTYNPRFNGSYSIAKNKHLWFNYNGRNQLPSLSQIQPLRNNTDELNQYEGNENLEPSFINSANIGYNSFQVLSGNYMYVGVNASLTKDPIAQNITQTGGRNIYRWANIDGKTNKSFGLWGGNHFKLNKDLGLTNSPQVGINLSENNNFFDGQENVVKTSNYSFTYQITRDTKTGLNFNLNFSPQYRKMTSNLRPDQNNNGFVFGSNGSLEYFITKTFKLYTNYDYSFEAATEAFSEDLSRFLIHPGISKKFFKNESLMLDFTINDLLNENIGYSRAQSNSVFVQRRFDTIQRYYMLKLSWDFNKMFVK